jgi:hypothetical protein
VKSHLGTSTPCFFGERIRPCAFLQFARRLDLSANCHPSESAAQKMLSTRSWEPDTRDRRHRRELRREAAECCEEVAALSARSAPSLGVITAGHRRACFDQIWAPLPQSADCPRRGWQVGQHLADARSTRAYLPSQAERSGACPEQSQRAAPTRRCFFPPSHSAVGFGCAGRRCKRAFRPSNAISISARRHSGTGSDAG